LSPEFKDTFQSRLQQAWEHHKAGRIDVARREYTKLLASYPDDPDLNNLAGLAFIQSGEPGQAIAPLQRALRIEPDNAQSHYNLALAFASLGQFEQAVTHFRKTTQLDPGNPEAANGLGNALRLLQRHDEARKWLTRALQLQSNHRGALTNLSLLLNDEGITAQKAGEVDAALVAFERATAVQPEHIQAWVNLGLTREQSGDLDGAATAYRQAVKAGPDFADAHFYLAHLRSHSSTSAEIEAMEQLFRDTRKKTAERIRLAFGLGFALESRGEFSKAFQYMTAGHQLQAMTQPFSLDREREIFGQIRTLFDGTRYDTQTGSGAPGEQVVFIAGMPRSGTTLAEQVLASHPEVEARGESMALARAANRLGWPFDGGHAGPDSVLLRDEARILLDELLTPGSSASRFVDTTPMNFTYFGLAALMLPGAKFIHCVRDPMDNGLSIYRQFLTGPRGFEHDLGTLGNYYRLHLELLEHWQQVLGERLYVLQYENLVTEPEIEIRALLNFIGLPFDARCLAFHQTRRLVRSPSAGQVRQPLYTRSIGAWRRYENELIPLSRTLEKVKSKP
jgi:Flp pilus assembly protein TadD